MSNNLPPEDRPQKQPKADLPLFQQKILEEKWKNRPELEAVHLDDDDAFNAASGVAEMFGHQLSREQFDEAINHPSLAGSRYITQIGNQVRYLHNSLFGQHPTIAGNAIDNINEKTIDLLREAETAHDNDNHNEALKGLNTIHEVYSGLHEILSAQNPTYMDSYTGLHLDDMVSKTLPNLIDKYKTTMEL